MRAATAAVCLAPPLLLGLGAAVYASGERATNTGEAAVLQVSLYDGTTLEGEVELQKTKLYVKGRRRRKLLYREVAVLREVPPPGEETLRREHARRVEGLEPGDADGWARVGRWADEAGLAEEARQAFERALEAAPDHEAARNGLGQLRDGEEWADARSVIAGRRVELTPDDLDGLIDLARFAQEHQADEEAYALLAEVLRRDPFHERALAALRPLTDRYRQTVALSLPVRGRWKASPDTTRHHAKKAYAVYALDLNKVDRDGRLYRGKGRRLEDHFSFGAPFYAAADGTVIEVRDGFPDNPIGEIGDRAEKHNGLAIDHGNGEISWYIHAKEGTIRVKVGDRVTRGQLLGEVGNSGGSAIPHLHFTLVDTNNLSVPWACDDYLLIAPDGTPIRVERACPREGWTLEAPEEE